MHFPKLVLLVYWPVLAPAYMITFYIHDAASVCCSGGVGARGEGLVGGGAAVPPRDQHRGASVASSPTPQSVPSRSVCCTPPPALASSAEYIH